MVRNQRIAWPALALIFLFGCVILPHPEQAVLREAYEKAKQILLEAQLSGDTSRLTEGYSHRTASAIAKSIHEESSSGEEHFLHEAHEVDWVKMVEYNPPEAVIEVKEYYRRFQYDPESGTRHYYDEPHRYWRIWRFRMIQEDGIWKIDEVLEFIDWSG